MQTDRWAILDKPQTPTQSTIEYKGEKYRVVNIVSNPESAEYIESLNVFKVVLITDTNKVLFDENTIGIHS
jgi:hypothetical protein